MDEETLRELWSVSGADLDAPVSDAASRSYRTEAHPPPDPATAPTLPGPPPPSASTFESAVSPSDRFELLTEVGRGGMGVVYRARQRTLEREVAVKKLREESGRLPAQRETFLAEAFVTAGLDHPNIVPVHELGSTEDGEPLIAMKLVTGVAWKDLLHPRNDAHRERAQAMELDDHLAILLAVCNAVAFAHSHGIVHCDLKPANVMVGEFGEVLVMDWGVAVDVRDAAGAEPRRPGARPRAAVRDPFGTPAYMAPELADADGAKISGRTDVYLLGAILHELLTGRPPHRAPTLMQVIVAASLGRPPELGPEAPRELAEICRKAMAADPAERFASATELAAAVTGFRKHRESTRISEAADETLARCRQTARGKRVSARLRVGKARSHQLYADFAAALAGYRQAALLWPGNEAAVAGAQRAAVAYAEAALAGGDVGLAEAQVDALDPARPETAALRERIAAARRRIEQAQSAARWLRAGLATATLALIAVLGTSYAFVRRERDRAVSARDAETRSRARAERYLARVLLERGEHALAKDHHPLAAEALFARSIALHDTGEARSGLLEARTLSPHAVWGTRTGAVARCLAFAPDGGWIAWGYDSGTIRLLDLRTGEKHLLRGHEDRVNAIAASPDGTRFASASEDGTVRVWSVADRSATVLGASDARVTGVCWADGTIASVGDDPGAGLRAWHEDGRSLTPVPATTGPATAVALGGDRVAVGDPGGQVTVYDLAGRTPPRTVHAHRGGVTTVGFMRGTEDLVTAGADRRVRVWHLDRPERPPHEIGALIGTDVVAVDPSGRWIATGTRGGIRLYDPRTRELGPALAGHEAAVTAIAFGPAGRLASTARDETLRVWDIAASPPALFERIAAGTSQPVRALAVLGEDRFAGATANGPLTVWTRAGGKWTAGEQVDRAPATVIALAASPDADRLAWIEATGEQRSVFLGTPGKLAEAWLLLTPVSAQPGAVAFRPDGGEIAVAGLALVRGWDTRTRAPIPAYTQAAEYYGEATEHTACAFSGDGRTIVLGLRSRAPESQRDERTQKLRRARIGVWNLPGQHATTLSGGAGAATTAIALAPAGERLAWGDEAGGMRFGELTGGEAVHRAAVREKPAVALHGDRVTGVAFGPDGRRVASVGEDGRLRLWSASGELALAVLVDRFPTTPLTGLDWRGARLVTGTKSGQVLVWDLDEIEGFLTRNADELVEASVARSGLAVEGLDVVPVERAWSRPHHW